MIQSAITLMQKDLRGFFRDRAALVASILVPIMLVTVFGAIMAYAFGGGSGGMPAVRLHVLDIDQTEASKNFVQSLRSVDMIQVRRIDPGDEELNPESARERLSKLIREGDSHHALLLDEGFGEVLDETGKPPLNMFRDPGRSMEDQIVSIALMQAALQQSDGRLWTGAMTGLLGDQGMDDASLVKIEDWMDNISDTIGDFAGTSDGSSDPSVDSSAGNEEANSEDSSNSGDSSTAEPDKKTPADTSADSSSGMGMAGMLDFFQDAIEIDTTDISPPGRQVQVTYQKAQSVAGMSVMMLLFALTGSASVLLLEREDGTLRRLFAQPIHRSSVLLGKFFFVFIVGVIQLTILFTYGEWMFDVGLFRDPVTLVVLSITWIATGGAFGMFLASACKSSKQAEGLSTLLILCMAALGGCWFPLQMMKLPAWLDYLSKSTPTYWAMTGYQGMLWNQLPWTNEKLLFAISVQLGWALVLSIASVFLFRRNYNAG